MRSRALVDTLAPGVKARDTAERETPARLATSAAVTNARRTDSWPNLSSRSCMGASSYALDAHVCKHRPNIRGNNVLGTTRRDATGSSCETLAAGEVLKAAPCCVRT